MVLNRLLSMFQLFLSRANLENSHFLGYRMRQRKQRDVAKENDFYLQLMQQALPADTVTEISEQETTAIVSSSPTAMQHNNNSANNKIQQQQQQTQQQQSHRQSHEKNGHVMNGVTSLPNGVGGGHSSKSHRKSLEKSKEHAEHEHR